jgi:hypothetical protein
MDQVLLGKPFVDLELRKFSFANEARISGALAAVRHRIPQIELVPETKEAISKEVFLFILKIVAIFSNLFQSIVVK